MLNSQWVSSLQVSSRDSLQNYIPNTYQGGKFTHWSISSRQNQTGPFEAGKIHAPVHIKQAKNHAPPPRKKRTKEKKRQYENRTIEHVSSPAAYKMVRLADTLVRSFRVTTAQRANTRCVMMTFSQRHNFLKSSSCLLYTSPSPRD